MLPSRVLLTVALLALLVGGSSCLMQPSVSVRITVADGSSMDVPLTEVPPPVTDGVVTIRNFQFAPWDMGKDKPKAIVFSFAMAFAAGSAPESIRVDDFTEEPILEIFTDPHGRVGKDGLYGGISKPFAPDDEHVKWIMNLDNNVRVYRFTVKLKDGTTHVLLRPIFVPAPMKDFIRNQLGIKA
jgi:hypothetical protein